MWSEPKERTSIDGIVGCSAACARHDDSIINTAQGGTQRDLASDSVMFATLRNRGTCIKSAWVLIVIFDRN
jgi:hypothetical protein